jgi:putative ABC transport system permease protein
MGHFIRLAMKNVFRQKKRSFTLGVNYAVVAFILVLLLAFSRGATKNISTSLVNASAGHITVSGQFAKDGKVFSGLLRVQDILSGAREAFGDNVKLVARYGVQSTVYFNGLSKRLPFSGIYAQNDLGYKGQSVFSAGSWDAFAADPNGVALPAEAAEYFGLSLNDEIVLSTRTRFGAFNTGILVVRGIYDTDNFFARGRVIAHYDFLRDLDLADKDAATSVFIYLPSSGGLSAKRSILAEVLRAKGFDVSVPKTDAEAVSAISSASTRYEEDKEGRDRVMLKLATLDEALGIVRSILAAVNGIGAFIAAVMLFVIAVSIFINLKMSINERLREIGTMRAMGMEAASVSSLFVFESVGLAVIFSASGAILASIISLIMLYGPVFPSGGTLGLFLDSGRLVLIPGLDSSMGVVLVISLFAGIFSYFPARRGGSIPPVDALTKTF